MAEYALRLPDDTLVRDPGWHCEADVMAGFLAFGEQQAFGTLVRREDDDSPWENVHRNDEPEACS